MKYLTAFVVISLLSIWQTMARRLSRVPGVVGKEDFDYVGVPFAPEAEAVILFDIRETKFIDTDNGFRFGK